jgi:hypothetical protein
MADPRRAVNEEAAKPPEVRRPSELEREERRLERLRLVVTPWPTPKPYEDFEPGPQEAA